MAIKQKKNFKINVREIDFGFIVTFRSDNDIVMNEMWCEDNDSIIGQIRTWIDKVFVEKEIL